MTYDFFERDIKGFHEEICIPSFRKYYKHYSELYGFNYISPNKTKSSTNYGSFWDSIDSYLKQNEKYEFDLSFPESPWTGMFLKRKYQSDRVLFLDGSLLTPKVSSSVKELFNLSLHKKYVELKIENSIKRYFILGGIDIDYLLIDKVFKDGFNSIKSHFTDSSWESLYTDLIKHHTKEYGIFYSFDHIIYSNLFTNEGKNISTPLLGLDNQIKNEKNKIEFSDFINLLKLNGGVSESFSNQLLNLHENHTGSNREIFYTSLKGIDNIQYHQIVPTEHYNDFIDTFRNPENEIRKELGLPKIGEGWISETKLFYLIKERFKNYRVIQHGKPKWLGKQHLDIYLPDFNIGIEYQGEQHSISVEIFGGDTGLTNTKERDRRKKTLCMKNQLTLFEVFPDDDFVVFVDKLSDLYL